MLVRLQDERKGKAEVFVFDQGDEPPEFWELIGGKVHTYCIGSLPVRGFLKFSLLFTLQSSLIGPDHE